ncbi:MAG: N-acetylglucosamine kinase [Proteobacteria bacterium]|nr:N-acetylglucosamine kinase [Pseudomonadota bacterium]
MSTFLGVDGGGTKTRFLLIDDAGRILAAHTAGPAYYLQTGLDPLRDMLTRGLRATLEQGGVPEPDLTCAFVGLPAYGEDRAVQPALDAAPASALPTGHYRCGNDMVCGWAGALAGEDGINIVAGTGSIAYGEFQGRNARAGGWGELFSDEASAYWLAREGLALFSRMSDGRAARGPLHQLVRAHFGLQEDLDLCAAVYGPPALSRSQLAALSRLVAEAAEAGDTAAAALFSRAISEMMELIDAVRRQLQVPDDLRLPVSCSGGMFELAQRVLAPLGAALSDPARKYAFRPAALPPHAGAALYAARIAGQPLAPSSRERLAAGLRRMEAGDAQP